MAGRAFRALSPAAIDSGCWRISHDVRRMSLPHVYHSFRSCYCTLLFLSSECIYLSLKLNVPGVKSPISQPNTISFFISLWTSFPFSLSPYPNQFPPEVSIMLQSASSRRKIVGLFFIILYVVYLSI